LVGKPGKYMIESGVDIPLTGDTATPLVYENTEIFGYGKSIFYEAVPFEMLR
jgi:hypothetical protein